MVLVALRYRLCRTGIRRIMRLNGAETRGFRSADRGETGAPLEGGDWVAEREGDSTVS